MLMFLTTESQRRKDEFCFSSSQKEYDNIKSHRPLRVGDLIPVCQPCNAAAHVKLRFVMSGSATFPAEHTRKGIPPRK